MAFFGTPAPQITQASRFDPTSLGIMNQLGTSGLANLQAVQNQYGFEPLAQRARTQFQTQTVPSIAERFTSMGGGQRSSAFQGALGQAGAGLEEGLAALGSQYGLQKERNLLSQLQMGLQPQFENIIQPGAQNPLATGVSSILQLLPLLLGGYFGGPAGMGLAGLLSQFGGK